MSELSIRLIGVGSLALSIIFQLTWFATEHQSRDDFPLIAGSYSVHPYFIYAALVLQIVLQVYWLLKPPARIQLKDVDTDGVFDIEIIRRDYADHVEDYISPEATGPLMFFDRLSYMPIYIFFNIFCTMWIIANHYGLFIPALVILLCSASIQLYSLFATPSKNICKDGLTMVVAKLNAAYTIMLISKMCAVFEATPSPPIIQLVNHGFVFVLLTIASGPDPTFGLAVVYILASLYHGSTLNTLWHNAFYWTAAVITAITTLDYVGRTFCSSIDDQEDQEDTDFEDERFLLSGEKSQGQAPTTIRIPDENIAGSADSPLPLSTAELGKLHAQGLLPGVGDSCHLPRWAQNSEKLDSEPLSVSSDYFSYAFAV
ncbi:hypothetical protein PM082_003730 [Marasmius tenuissimus]|nr:hypothetical protein PM082_003730 [Marasmius tenuissimus]